MSQVPPWPLEAIVISQDPDNYSLNVSIQGALGGQMPSVPVKVVTHGPRDALLTNQPELPRRGTVGLVIFLRGDSRNGHWIGATDPAQIDASAHAPGSPNIAYSSHYGGGWSHRDQDGTVYEHFPDGTSLLVGNSVPKPTRHTLDANQARTRTEFTQSQRMAGTASGSFQAVLSHPSGATATLNASGAWTLVAAANQPVSVMVSGGATLTLQAGGGIVLAPAAAQPVTVSGDVHATGAIIAGFGGGDQASTQLHRHLTTGGSGTSTTAPLAGT